MREFRDNEEDYGRVLDEFKRFIEMESDPYEYRIMALDVLRTAALENPRDLRYLPYIKLVVDRLLKYGELHKYLINDFEFLFGEFYYLEHIYPISRVFWEALERLGAANSLQRLKREILSSGNKEWISRGEELNLISLRIPDL